MHKFTRSFVGLVAFHALAGVWSGCSSSSSGAGPDAGGGDASDASFPSDGPAAEAGPEAASEAAVDASDGSTCAGGGFAWATAGGGSGQYNAVHGVAVDKDGNTWVSGTFIGQAKWGSTMLTASDAVHTSTFFAKLDPTGKVLFARALDSQTYSGSEGRIRVDPQGNAYIVGTFTKSLTLDGVTLVQNDNLAAGAAFVIKVDPTGKALWGIASANMGGSDESGHDVAIDPANGDVYLVGSYNGYAVFYNPGMPDDGGTPPAVVTTQANGGDEKAYIAKFSQASMTWQWAKGWIGNGNDGGVAQAVVLDAGHSTVTVFGDIHSELTVEGVNLAAAGGSFVATLAQNDGHLVWVSQIDPNGGSALVHGAAIDSSGSIYAAGEFQGSATFDAASTFALDGGAPSDAGAGAITLMPSGGTDAFLVKYDATGTATWAKHGGASNAITRADDVALDGQNGVYIAGFTQGATFDGQAFMHTGNLFAARYETSGAIQWLTGNELATPDATSGSAGEGNALSVTSPSGGISVGGGFGSDPIALGSLQVNATGIDTGLVTRLCN